LFGYSFTFWAGHGPHFSPCLVALNGAFGGYRAPNRNIDPSAEKQQRLQQILAQCARLGGKVLAEGVATAAALHDLAAQSVDWFQGIFCQTSAESAAK
jgi:hypothetical protein